MVKSEVRIIRGNNVRIQGQHRLGLAPGLPGPAGQPASHNAQPRQVAIVQSNPEFAVVEVTCACGRKMHFRCTYAPTEPKETAPQPDGKQRT